VEALTYSTVAVTLGLVVARPRIGPRFRLTPALAALIGVAILAAIGSVSLADVGGAAATMWRPLVGIVSIMLMTGVARRTGVLAGVADFVFARAMGSPAKLFAYVFVFGVLTAAVLNNDSAILLLTPLVVDAAKRRHRAMVVPLAFAVFLSAGVAPLVVSNPMNMVVASVAGIGFNEYASRMVLPAVAAALVTFAMAYLVFRKTIQAATLAKATAAKATVGKATAADPANEGDSAPLNGRQKLVLGALASVVLAYPLVSYAGGPVWAVAACGAALLLGVGAWLGERPADVARNEIHLDVVVFLVAVLVLSIGLRNVGLVDRLAHVYAGASPFRIGAVSALGSAILNNHPMGHLNMMALRGEGHGSVLAALVGGDLGPRLSPIGSLAGLLWLEMLRRSDVEVSVRRFVLVGVVSTVPALAVCLLFF
jgi:arsenical pump membrane protein